MNTEQRLDRLESALTRMAESQERTQSQLEQLEGKVSRMASLFALWTESTEKQFNGLILEIQRLIQFVDGWRRGNN